jgi:hypothetical protein
MLLGGSLALAGRLLCALEDLGRLGHCWGAVGVLSGWPLGGLETVLGRLGREPDLELWASIRVAFGPLDGVAECSWNPLGVLSGQSWRGLETPGRCRSFICGFGPPFELLLARFGEPKPDLSLQASFLEQPSSEKSARPGSPPEDYRD